MSNVVRSLALLPLFALAVACPGDKRGKTAAIPVDSTKVDTAKAVATTDTTPTDLSKIPAHLPSTAPDTFRPRKITSSGGETGVGSQTRTRFADAPTPLVDAVEREQSATRFCYTEFGQKADPTLRGNVAMLVTIGNSGVTDAEVADSKWTGAAAGRAVNRCLNQKAKQAWNVAPGAVNPGHYVVQLSFSGAR